VLLLSFTCSPLSLLIVLTFGCGILSAYFLNDTIALIFTPLALSLTLSLGLNPIPYLLAIVGATNIGSVTTLSGNPQNNSQTKTQRCQKTPLRLCYLASLREIIL
jgi:Na+/H+ antiporter NhaD/arsenite permease-like protein